MPFDGDCPHLFVSSLGGKTRGSDRPSLPPTPSSSSKLLHSNELALESRAHCQDNSINKDAKDAKKAEETVLGAAPFNTQFAKCEANKTAHHPSSQFELWPRKPKPIDNGADPARPDEF